MGWSLRERRRLSSRRAACLEARNIPAQQTQRPLGYPTIDLPLEHSANDIPFQILAKSDESDRFESILSHLQDEGDQKKEKQREEMY